MSRVETLKRLETMIEDFLDQATALKEERLTVLGGMNRLDDLARASTDGVDVSDHVAEWFADRRVWPDGGLLRESDRTRISDMLDRIGQEITKTTGDSPAGRKVNDIITQWLKSGPVPGDALTLRRGPEEVVRQEVDSIKKFRLMLARLTEKFDDHASGKDHLLSALDRSLKQAVENHDREALLLSAYIIYYLRLGKYMVEPYVKRLKEAEKLFSGKEKS